MRRRSIGNVYAALSARTPGRRRRSETSSSITPQTHGVLHRSIGNIYAARARSPGGRRRRVWTQRSPSSTPLARVSSSLDARHAAISTHVPSSVTLPPRTMRVPSLPGQHPLRHLCARHRDPRAQSTPAALTPREIPRRITLSTDGRDHGPESTSVDVSTHNRVSFASVVRTPSSASSRRAFGVANE